MALVKRTRTRFELLTAATEPIKLIEKIDGMNVWLATNENGESVHVGIPDWKVEADELTSEGTWFTFHWDNKRFIVDDIFDEE